MTTFGTAIGNGFQGEVVVGASLGQAGFASGDVYAGAGSQIYHYSNSGGTPTLFTSTPDGSTVRGIMFDPGSTFGGNMLVTTTSGDILSISSAGAVTVLANVGEDAEGMDILGAGWGKYTGDLAVTSEGSGDVRLINPNGTIDFQEAVVSSAETVSYVPMDLGLSGDPVEGFYVANYPDDIQKASASDFSASLLGNLIVTSEDGSNSRVTDIAYSGNDLDPFKINGVVGHLASQSEDGIFVTAQRINDTGVPEPSSLPLLGAVVAGACFLAGRRRTATTR